MATKGFRLLTEYHSFLLETMVNSNNKIVANASFRLLTEYHSFLFRYEIDKKSILWKFPSPYGVSFILIKKINVWYYNIIQGDQFPSPYGVSFILI